MAEWIKGTVMFFQQFCWYLLVKHLDEAEKLQTLPYIHRRQLVTSGMTHFKIIKWEYLCYKSVSIVVGNASRGPTDQPNVALYFHTNFLSVTQLTMRISKPYLLHVLQSRLMKLLKMTPLWGSEIAFCWKQSLLRLCP